MLDLAFVRANLPLVEEKLRARNMDPVAILGNFANLDRARRDAITEAESVKAQRNRLSEEIGKLKRTGGDTTLLAEETRVLRATGEHLEAAAAAADEQLRAILHSIPNLPHESVPVGRDEHANTVEKTW